MFSYSYLHQLTIISLKNTNFLLFVMQTSRVYIDYLQKYIPCFFISKADKTWKIYPSKFDVRLTVHRNSVWIRKTN